MQILQTPRTVLRTLGDSDFDDLHALFSDPGVMKYLDDFTPYSRQKSMQALENAKTSYQTFGFGPWALLERKSGQFIGTAGIEMLPGRGEPEISYIIGTEWWGQGLAGEVAAALVAFGFDALGLSAIGASVDPRNSASIRIIEKLGMTYFHDGRDEFGMPAKFYRLDRGHWLERGTGRSSKDSGA